MRTLVRFKLGGKMKMRKVRDALWQDYTAVSSQIKSLKADDDGYQTALEERDKLRNELIKLSQIEEDNRVKISQIEAEDRREKIRNGITIGTFIVSTGISIYAIAKTFKFDQVATVTSTLGRNILNGVVPKMLKR